MVSLLFTSYIAGSIILTLGYSWFLSKPKHLIWQLVGTVTFFIVMMALVELTLGNLL